MTRTHTKRRAGCLCLRLDWVKVEDAHQTPINDHAANEESHAAATAL
ncbi:MAG: hypothetical protein ACSW8D_17390 [Prevotella sp.]